MTLRKRLLITGLALAFVPAGFGQNTNPPQFMRVRKTPDTPVVVEWASDPRTVYRIEASSTLTPGSWQIAQENFPPQGTNTFWTDTGRDSSFSPRISSAEPDAPYRFYRLAVERYMSNSPAITVNVSTPSSGATLTGLVDVSASASAPQGVASAKIYVDGDEVNTGVGSSYTLPLETRYYPNGTHRLSVVAMDAGGLESTEQEVAASTNGPTFGSANVTVTFSNDLSNVRLRHRAFRPDLGQTQHIYAVWSSPRMWRVDISTRDNPLSVFRSFLGESSKIDLLWDGTDSLGGQIDPQIIGHHFYDLGPGTEPSPSPGGGGEPPPAPGSGESAMASYPSSPMEAMLAGMTSYFLQPPPWPPLKIDGKWVPWDVIYGPVPPVEMTIPEATLETFLATMTQTSSSVRLTGSEPLAGLEFDPTAPSFSIYWPIKRLGTVGVLSQGHHPSGLFSSYPTPSRGPGLGRVRMSSRDVDGPWGALAAPGVIAADCNIGFPTIGYECLVQLSDDFCDPDDLRSTGAGGSNTLNQVNIGLFTGHSVAGRDIQLSVGYLQSYVPIYNKAADTMTFVEISEMFFGSSNLKWMAFYSCNMFRDGLYRADGIYDQLRNNFALPMSGELHILQGFATENTVHPDMVFFWTQALAGKTPHAGDWTVIGAWKHVCDMTQPPEAAGAENVARSIYWPECFGDYIYGYGPQTDPDRDPEDPLEQGFLLEDDHHGPIKP